MEELQHLTRRLDLVEDRQISLESKHEKFAEKQERFAEALQTLQNDLNETERRIHEKLDELKETNQAALARIEDHLHDQDNHLIKLANQIGQSKGRMDWPPAAKIMVGGLVSIVTALIAAVIKFIKGS